MVALVKSTLSERAHTHKHTASITSQKKIDRSPKYDGINMQVDMQNATQPAQLPI